MVRVTRLGAALVVASLGACGGSEGMGLAEAPALVSTDVDGEPIAVIPTRPLRLTFSAAPELQSFDADAIAVVIGAVDDATRLALERAAKGETNALRDRIAPVQFAPVEGDGNAIDVQPLRPLAGSTLYTLVVTRRVRCAGKRLGHAEVRVFSTAATTAGAASLMLVDPPDGSLGVVRNLRRALVRFSRSVRGVDRDSLRLVDENGAPIDLVVKPGASETEFSLELQSPLAPAQRYHLVAGSEIHDDEGHPPFATGEPPGFTSSTDLRAHAPLLDGLSWSASSGCVVARFTTDVAASAVLCVDSDCSESGLPSLVHAVSQALAPGATSLVRLDAHDESTAPAAVVGPVAAPVTSPRPLSIVAVLSRPKVGRLQQQWVEIENRSALPVELGGLELRDEKGANTLPEAMLAGGARAVIVPAGYAEPVGGSAGELPDDRGPVALLVVHVEESHLGGNGIRGSGEALVLAEADGRPVSRFSTENLQLAAGQSARRRGPCDVADSYEPAPGPAAKPGGP